MIDCAIRTGSSGHYRFASITNAVINGENIIDYAFGEVEHAVGGALRYPRHGGRRPQMSGQCCTLHLTKVWSSTDRVNCTDQGEEGFSPMDTADDTPTLATDTCTIKLTGALWPISRWHE